MAKTLMWMVRAGENGYLFEDFRTDSFVAIGWNEIGDLTQMDSQEKIRELYLNVYQAEKPAKVSNAVAMIFKFRSVLKPGHKVTTYDPETREYLIGTIKGDYEYAPNRKYHHVRSVDWSDSVGRDSLTPASRNSLGSTLTLF